MASFSPGMALNGTNNIIIMKVRYADFYRRKYGQVTFPALFLLEFDGKNCSVRFCLDDRQGIGSYGFSINLGYGDYYIGEQVVSREIFVDSLRESYPDYFEWFLFNPEWFG